MAEASNGTALDPSPGNWPYQPGRWPGSYYQNELGKLLPEPFPPPFPEMPAPSLERLTREYVAGGGWAWYGQVARTLPNAIDDITAEFGDDLYERMMFDPQIAAVTQVFKASILENGLTLTSAVRSRTDPNYDLAAEIADEAEHMLAEFDGNLDDILYNMLDCVAYGNKVAEQTYKLQKSRKDGRKILVLDKLKVRPRRSTVFAVDIYLNVVGLLIRVPPNASPWSSTMMFGPQDEPFNLLPPHKFVVATNRVKDNDPRGTSILRPAYSPWWRKQQILPEYLKYISQFAGPSIWATVPENAIPYPNPAGGEISAEQVLLGALQAFRNGTAGAFPYGTELHTIMMSGEGATFLKALDHCDQQMTKAVLTQELATEEGKHMARAAAEVHQDVLDTLIRQGKLAFARQFRNQLLKRWVSYNWGDDALHLAPIVGLGKTIMREQPALWTAIAQLTNTGYLAPSQYQPIDEMIGLPIRDESEVVPLGYVPADRPLPPPSATESADPETGADTSTGDSTNQGQNDQQQIHKVDLPERPTHRKTTAKPAMPGVAGGPPKKARNQGVPGTTKLKPGQGKGVYAVSEPANPASSGTSLNANLPSPSPGTFG